MIAIVTGVAGGIGKACALALANKGYEIVGMGRSETPDLSDFEGYAITYVPGDISSTADRERLVQTAAARGRIGALINVAGVAPKVRRDLLETLETIGCGNVIVQQRGKLGVVPDNLDCDYYDWCDGKRMGIVWHGEYMAQYSWSEYTAGVLERMNKN